MNLMDMGGSRLPPGTGKDVFYGLRLDPKTGHFSIEVIAAGEGVVRLPQPGVIDPNDYKQWIWTSDTLTFAFSTNGHLEMTIL